MFAKGTVCLFIRCFVAVNYCIVPCLQALTMCVNAPVFEGLTNLFSLLQQPSSPAPVLKHTQIPVSLFLSQHYFSVFIAIHILLEYCYTVSVAMAPIFRNTEVMNGVRPIDSLG